MGGDVCWDGTFIIASLHEHNVYTRRFHQDDLHYTISLGKVGQKSSRQTLGRLSMQVRTTTTLKKQPKF